MRNRIFTILAWAGGCVFLFYGSARAETFHQIKTSADFQNALTIAQSNGEDDVIKLPGKTFSASGGTFLYVPAENHSLTIIGANIHSTKLDGGNAKQVLMIDTTTIPNGGDGDADVTIKNLTIQNGSGQDLGGGLGVTTINADISLDKCAVSNNTVSSGNSGGAGLLSFGSGNITVTDSIFSENKAPGSGGLRVDSRSGIITVSGNLFTANKALNSLMGEAGLNVGARDGNTLVSGNTFDRNESAGPGGGMTATLNGSGSTTMVNNMFTNNSASFSQNGTLTGLGGGGAFLGNNGTGDLTVTNNSFFGNKVHDSGSGPVNGGGMWLKIEADSTRTFLFNNIVVGNTADGHGNDIYADDDGNPSNHDNIGSPIQVSHNDYGDFYSFCVNTAGCTPNVTLAANLPNLDPLFVDGPNGDLHLTLGSPCIDQGDSAAPGLPATDIDGDPRIIGPAPDIGADEFNNP
jgi:hypothetical protein